MDETHGEGMVHGRAAGRMSDLINDRDCSHCIWHTDGRCASWDCEYINRAEALEALEQLKRADTLLTATYDLLQKQYKNIYVLNLLAETINYDEAECDGNCLMEDIEAWMIERGIDHDDDEQG